MFKSCFRKSVTCLHWLSFSNYEDVQHVDIRVLTEDVGFSVMLEMPVIPPVGRRSLKKQPLMSVQNFRNKYDYDTIENTNYLQMTNDKLVQQVIPAGLLEDRQVAKVMLQPSSLQLQKMKRNRH